MLVDALIRHAEHYGTDEVFETAVDGGVNLMDLGKLSLRLQNLDPKWKLTPEVQQLFVLALLHWRLVDVRDAARMAGVTATTAKSWYEDYVDGNLLEDLDCTPDLALRRASELRFVDLKGIVRGWHRTSK